MSDTILITPEESIPVTCNEANVRSMVDAIVREPNMWKMNFWADYSTIRDGVPCGTTYCAAGHTLIQHGYVSDFRGSWFKDGEDHDVEDTAVQLLGLKDTNLFYYITDTDPVTGKSMHVTIRQFVQRVANITGLEFKIPVDVADTRPAK